MSLFYLCFIVVLKEPHPIEIERVRRQGGGRKDKEKKHRKS
jgi:hypothetical protein